MDGILGLGKKNGILLTNGNKSNKGAGTSTANG